MIALSVMAICNMCDYSEDIKDIFYHKNGLQILVDLLGNKDEDILLNTQKLLLALITQKKTETSQFGKQIGEDQDYRIIRRLI